MDILSPRKHLVQDLSQALDLAQAIRTRPRPPVRAHLSTHQAAGIRNRLSRMAQDLNPLAQLVPATHSHRYHTLLDLNPRVPQVQDIHSRQRRTVQDLSHHVQLVRDTLNLQRLTPQGLSLHDRLAQAIHSPPALQPRHLAR